MNRQPLTRTLRIRVIIVAVGAVLLALLMLPLEIATLTAGDATSEDIALVFAMGVGLPALFALLMWWQVHRFRSSPELQRRQPNGPAARIMLFGNLAVLVLGMLVATLSGVEGWRGWVLGLVVVVVGSFVVVRFARSRDPRVHYFRRTDPMPEGQEPDDGPSTPTW
jgi:hypothetical protein